MQSSFDGSFLTARAELESHLSDHYPRIDNFGELSKFFEKRVSSQQYPLSFLDPRFSSVEEWRAQALPHLENCLQRPRELKLDSTIRGEIHDLEYCTQEEWSLHTTGGTRIPASVFIPKGKDGPYPAIIALHSMGGMRVFGREKLFPSPRDSEYLRDYRQVNYDGNSLVETFVKKGFLVIAIDALGFGERVAEWNLDEDFLSRRWNYDKNTSLEPTEKLAHRERAASYAAILAGTTWAGLVAQDDILTLDYLCTRSDVDVSRIGCTGLSFGSYRTNYLAALDERVKAAVSVCWHSALSGIVGYNVSGAMGAFTLIPGIHPNLDLCDISSLACPRAFLAISGWKDRLMQPSGMAMAHLKMRSVWEKAGQPECLGSLIYDTRHHYNITMQDAATAWFEQHLS